MDSKEQLDKAARSLGWSDHDQMIYYEGMATAEYLQQVQALPDAPSGAWSTNTHELEKIDPREAYQDYEYMAGVY